MKEKIKIKINNFFYIILQIHFTYLIFIYKD